MLRLTAQLCDLSQSNTNIVSISFARKFFFVPVMSKGQCITPTKSRLIISLLYFELRCLAYVV